MIPLLILAPSTRDAWVALQRLGISHIDRRIRICTRPEQLRGWGRSAVGAVVGDDIDSLSPDMKAMCADRDVRLIKFDTLPTALAGMARHG